MSDDLQVADQLISAAPAPRALSTIAFHQLADVPPALTWFANIDNPQTRRAYQNDVEEFMLYAGITDPLAFRDVARAHVLAWRCDLELRALGGATIRRKLAALSSLFESLCEANAIQGNPVDGVIGQRTKAQRVKRRRSPTTRRVRCWRPQTLQRCAACAIAAS